MTYWTVLVLTIFVNGQQMQSRLLFPSMKACGDASSVIYHTYVKTHFRDSIAQCEKSAIPSKGLGLSQRPKPRPAWLEKSYHNVSNQPEMGGSNIGVLEGDEQ
jgi:hypothetical protein